ncbi:MAG: hypothetical protein WC688_01745 [Parachlamydiales bacterium]|jgi:AcrR family transcriptional regulator
MTLQLRQKKIYKTKLALAQVFIEKMKTEKFDAISIKDICAQAEICEATFFNYFPQKTDVIAYLLKVKLFKIYWTISNLQRNLHFTKIIEKVFELFANEIYHPYIFREVILIIGTIHKQINTIAISPEELQYIYPECPDIENVHITSLPEFFEGKIVLAIKQNLISKDICAKTLVQFLMTILKGVPLSIPNSEFNNIAEIYQKHLSLLWKIFQL